MQLTRLLLGSEEQTCDHPSDCQSGASSALVLGSCLSVWLWSSDNVSLHLCSLPLALIIKCDHLIIKCDCQQWSFDHQLFWSSDSLSPDLTSVSVSIASNLWYSISWSAVWIDIIAMRNKSGEISDIGMRRRWDGGWARLRESAAGHNSRGGGRTRRERGGWACDRIEMMGVSVVSGWVQRRVE